MRFQFILSSLLVLKIGHCQKSVSGQLLSIIDSTPVSNSTISICGKKIKTDINGSFTTTVNKKQQLWFDTYPYVCSIDTINATISSLQLGIYIASTLDSNLAVLNLANNFGRLYCGGSIAPLAPMKSDKEFEKTYGIRYEYLDCVRPTAEELISYNRAIATYLDRKFGTKWRENARPDVWGITK